MNVETLSDDADETIFTGNIPSGNEALVKEAVAILENKGQMPELGSLYSEQAKVMLVVAYDKIRQEQSKYNKAYPFMDVPNFFGPQSSYEDMTGRF